jgi:small subunit ribosomal protein S6
MTQLAEPTPSAPRAANRRLVHEYETIYILQPTTPPSEADKVSSRIVEVLSRLGGTLVQVDNWGKRRLAYPIRKSSRGIFVYVRYAGFNDLVAEVERNLRLLDPVMRFQTIRVRGDVDPASFQIDPEDVKFVAVEVTEEEEEENIEQRLGLVAAPDVRVPDEMEMDAADDEADVDAEGDVGPLGTDEEDE